MAGRPKKWTTRSVNDLIRKMKDYLTETDFPTVAGFCKKVKITRYQYKYIVQEFEKFRDADGDLKNMQQDLLIRYGLSGKYNAQFSMFMLKNVHGFKESTEVNVNEGDRSSQLAKIVAKAEGYANGKVS